MRLCVSRFPRLGEGAFTLYAWDASKPAAEVSACRLAPVLPHPLLPSHHCRDLLLLPASPSAPPELASQTILFYPVGPQRRVLRPFSQLPMPRPAGPGKPTSPVRQGPGLRIDGAAGWDWVGISLSLSLSLSSPMAILSICLWEKEGGMGSSNAKG